MSRPLSDHWSRLHLTPMSIPRPSRASQILLFEILAWFCFLFSVMFVIKTRLASYFSWSPNLMLLGSPSTDVEFLGSHRSPCVPNTQSHILPKTRQKNITLPLSQAYLSRWCQPPGAPFKHHRPTDLLVIASTIYSPTWLCPTYTPGLGHAYSHMHLNQDINTRHICSAWKCVSLHEWIILMSSTLRTVPRPIGPHWFKGKYED